MPIPPLDEDGFLPEGIHNGSPMEVRSRFGSFQGSDRRLRLWKKLAEFLRELDACNLVEAVLVNGSFVTAKPAPNDIDLILVVRATHDFGADLSAAEYRVLSKRRVSQRHGFDLLVARADSEEYQRYVAFFQQVRLVPSKKKGIIRLIV